MCLLIIFANIFVLKGKIKFNIYFIHAFFPNFLFCVHNVTYKPKTKTLKKFDLTKINKQKSKQKHLKNIQKSSQIEEENMLAIFSK